MESTESGVARITKRCARDNFRKEVPDQHNRLTVHVVLCEAEVTHICIFPQRTRQLGLLHEEEEEACTRPDV